MASSFSKIRDDFEGNLEEQVASLRKEVSTLTKLLSKRGAAAYSDTREGASDLYDELWNRLVDALPRIRKQARDQARFAGKKAHDNPVATAVVGIAVLGLLVSLLVRR
jgi:ElaB/YqjD/DUF883 family membrane-anchored ribosome-binding protein